jgi:RHS repeat-associated protein
LVDSSHFYVGNYERIEKSGRTEHKYYLAGAVITKESGKADNVLFMHNDHQGSITSITDTNGNVQQQFIYDPWGKKTEVLQTATIAAMALGTVTNRGYTGHEGLNYLDLIHMNGRVYDPTIGRFLQADPHVQAPNNSQNYNRYSYVLNNPMSYTDPSGYFFKKLLSASMKISGSGHLLRAIASNKYLNFIATVAACSIGPQACAAYSFASTFAVTGSLNASIKNGAIAYASAKAFEGIGEYFNTAGADNALAARHGVISGDTLHSFGGNYLTSGQIAGQIASHAVTGGVISTLSGGKFGHGFFAAGVTKGAGGAWLPGGARLSSGQIAGGTVVSAIIGGTASVISGGKFANGANTGAFQYLFNQAGRSCGGRPCSNRTAKNVLKRWAMQVGLRGGIKVLGASGGDFGLYVGFNEEGDVDYGSYETISAVLTTSAGTDIGILFSWGDIYVSDIVGESVSFGGELDTPLLDAGYGAEMLIQNGVLSSKVIHNFSISAGPEMSAVPLFEASSGGNKTLTQSWRF